MWIVIDYDGNCDSGDESNNGYCNGDDFDESNNGYYNGGGDSGNESDIGDCDGSDNGSNDVDGYDSDIVSCGDGGYD